jgi:hypothetical protein
MQEQQHEDERLWKIARRRAEFRKSLFSYIAIVGFMWGIWWFTTGQKQGFSGYPWPVWIMLGWGIGLAFQFFKAYNGDKEDLAQQEYDRLKREKGE